MEENRVYEIIYLAEALHWSFDDIWNMPTAMRKRFIDVYEEILKKRREKEDSRRKSSGTAPSGVFT